MKIVITDGYAVNPGDLSWEDIALYGEVEIHEHTIPIQLFDRVKDADIIITNKTVIDSGLIHSCHNLKLICVSATGYNNVDLDAATECNVVVCNAADYSSKSVAQHVLALVLHVYNRVFYYAQTVREGRWSRSRDFTYFDHSIEEISSKTVGIIGFGAIGQEVASVFHALGAQILIHEHPSKELTLPEDYKAVSRSEFLERADIISLHVPLNNETEGMVDQAFFKSMKKTAILINTARGAIVDESDLIEALENNDIHSAGIDVLIQEPPLASKLFQLHNCIVTPHQAWTSLQARKKLLEITRSNIEGFLNGNLRNKVN